MGEGATRRRSKKQWEMWLGERIEQACYSDLVQAEHHEQATHHSKCDGHGGAG